MANATQAKSAAVPWRVSTSARLAKSKAAPAARYAFPDPGSWTMKLGNIGEVAKPSTDFAGRLPVQVAGRVGWASGESLRVEVFDRATAWRVGASGFVFAISGGSRPRDLPVRLTIDYAGFANAYGASYADRLQVVSLPSCALKNPVPARCDTSGVRISARNDRLSQKLTAEVKDVNGTASPAESNEPSLGVFAVTSAVSGDEGTFAATPLSVTGSWQVNPGSGEFNYSYPVDVPKPAGGSAPTVSLSYSSGAVDGLTLATNTQANPNGVGWSDFANAFIERRYEPCIATVGTADLCWKSDNATISLGGVSGPLLPVNAQHSEWRVQGDPGWKIERLTGAPYTEIYQKQYWKVTGPDGTVYFFGYGHMPGRVTNSTLSVPVLADNSGEPCRTADDQVGGCDQGWRWYLDRVVDPDGNVTSYLYQREENWYSAIGGLAGNNRYHRGALLKEVIYGGRGWDQDNYAARITFGTQWRCNELDASCPAPTASNGSQFPDVPNDLICTQSSTCTAHAPTFFTAGRYSHVRTDVRIGGAWKPVAQHNIYQSFGDGLNGVVKKLQVDSLQYAGIAFDSLAAYPLTTFRHTYKDNRADHDRQIPKAMRHRRIDQVTNPFGGRIIATYSQNRPCAPDYDPWPRWDQNVRDCFPQSTKDGSFLRTGVFNKYLVTQVVESPGGGSPNMTTSYAYEGDPAWAFDTGAFARDEDETGWSQWHGYGTATITKGTSKTRLRVFRGWDQDPTLVQDASGDWVPLGKRSVRVETLDGSASYVDHHALAGRTAEEQQLGTLNGIPDSVLQSRRYEYEKRTTVDPGEDYLFDAEWVGSKSTLESVATAPGVFRQRRSQTTYNAHFQPTSTLEEGWLDVTGDERCSITTYADNSTLGMYVYPAVNRTVAGNCASTQVLSQSETYYDGSTTLGAPPQRGNATRQRTQIESNRWSETTTEFDDLGRPIRGTDPIGAVTANAYAVTSGAPATQIPIRTTATNALGHQTVTDWVPEFGVESRVQDANGNVTSFGYDVFGRLETVWLPTEPVAFLEPSWRFSYDIPNRAVRSRQLLSEARSGSEVVLEDTWTIHDGYWRERQVQGKSPTAGKALVSETTYDDRGLLYDETIEQALAGTPGTYIAGGSGWLNRTRHFYDALEREVRKEWFRGSTAAYATTTSYGVDTVTVTGPDGRRVREKVDGLGRPIAVEEFDGQGWVSSSYRYDLADRLLSAIDPAGNRIDYTYNLAGWRANQTDPNRGSARYTYDNAGNQTSSVDALNRQIWTRYDALGRKTERRAGSQTGQLLAAWTYDAAPGGKGQLHRGVSYSSSGTFVSEALGYDAKSRPTGSKLTVPAGIPGLSGSYPVTQTYDRADRVQSVTYPAIGGLPQETVTTDYNTLGLPTRLAGLNEYVWNVAYDDRGRRTSAGIGPRPNSTTWMAKTWTYNADQQLNGAETYVAGSSAPNGVVSDHELAFDFTGNLSEDVTRLNGQTWRECFGYDPRSRLTSAYTVTVGTSCEDGTPGTGDLPYTHGYQYSADGKLVARTENGVTTGYTYPASGTQHPHAPTRVGTNTYSWNADGGLASRTVSGQTETFAWNIDSTLESVTGPDGKTSFVYDASGQRLLRRTPDGQSTLYVAGHEVTANASGSTVTAVRPYTFDGQLVATRTPSGVEYLISGPDGSIEMAVPAGGIPNTTRAYAPYGRARAQTGETDTDRGFLGQIEDASTKLSYLNARYYDTTTGVFISADALFDTSKVKSLNPYSYSLNNPTTFADPSGMYSMYTWGLEVENSQLRHQNKELIAHIGRLNNYIEDLQDIIRKQQSDIKKLLTYVGALEAEIARQASIIRKLQARIAELQRVVAAQQAEIGRLKRRIARLEYAVGYYKGIVNQLGLRLWGGMPQYESIMASIHSFQGIPDGAFNYDRISSLQREIGPRPTTTAGGDADSARRPPLASGDAATRIAEAKLGNDPAHRPPLPPPVASIRINTYKTAPGAELCSFSRCPRPPQSGEPQPGSDLWYILYHAYSAGGR